MKTLRESLAELVAIDTSTRRSSGPLIDLLAGRTSALGFSNTRHPFVDADGRPRENLVALSSSDGPPALTLVAHTDTVPFDPSWTDALLLTEREGRLHARGACDTKGFMACALEAASRVERASLKRPLALVFTDSEENGCQGASALARDRVVKPTYSIVGEPTCLTPVRAHKGHSRASVEVVGREAHSSVPGSGVSAIFAAARLLERIEDIARILSREIDPEFDPPYTTINVGQIAGGLADNVIPGRCRFSLEWRSIPDQPPSRVLDVIRAAARDVAAEGGVQIEVKPLLSAPGFETSAQSPLVSFLEQKSGNPAKTVSFFTEASAFASLGAEVVVFGPGSIEVAHSPDEHVPADQLDRCADILTEAIRHFCCS